MDAAGEPRDRRAPAASSTSPIRAQRASADRRARSSPTAFVEGDASSPIDGADRRSAREMATLEGASATRHPFIATRRAISDFRLWFADYVTREPAPASSTPRPATAPTTTGPARRTACRRTRRSTTRGALTSTGRLAGRAHRQVDRRGEPDDRRAPRASTGVLLNPPTDKVHHSYPHCWRCKNPIMFARRRSGSRAWTTTSCCASARSPRSTARRGSRRGATNRIYAMIENRPDWVLSRQRAVGHADPGRSTATSVRRAHARRRRAWITSRRSSRPRAPTRGGRARSASSCRPGTKCTACGAGATARAREGHRRRLVRVGRVVAARWQAARRRAPTIASIDLYLEGSDQHRGWFHSSLLAGIGVARPRAVQRGASPTASCSTRTASRTRSRRSRRRAREGKKVELHPARRRHQEAGRGAVPAVGRVGRVPQRHPYSRAHPRRQLGEWYRKLPQHRALPARQPRRTSIPIDPRPSAIAKLDRARSLPARAARRGGRGARASAYEEYELHVVLRAARRLRHASICRRSTSTSTKDRLYSRRASIRRRGAPRRRCCTQCLRALAALAAPILCFTAEDIWTHMPRKPAIPKTVHLALLPAGGPSTPRRRRQRKWATAPVVARAGLRRRWSRSARRRSRRSTRTSRSPVRPSWRAHLARCARAGSPTCSWYPSRAR